MEINNYIIGGGIALLFITGLICGALTVEGVAEINFCSNNTCITQGYHRITGYNQINISKIELDFRMKELKDAVYTEGVKE